MPAVCTKRHIYSEITVRFLYNKISLQKTLRSAFFPGKWRNVRHQLSCFLCYTFPVHTAYIAVLPFLLYGEAAQSKLSTYSDYDNAESTDWCGSTIVLLSAELSAL